MKAKRNKTLRIWAGVGGVVIVAGLLLAADGITGDPLSRAWAESCALAYAERAYPDKTFTVQNSYAGSGFSYGVTVGAEESADTRFDVETRFWLLTHGNEDSMVENRHWTLMRQGVTGAQAIEDILDEACPQYERAENYSGWLPGTDPAQAAPLSVELDLCWTSDKTMSGAGEYVELFPLDSAFDPAVTAEVPDGLCALILWDGAPAWDDLQTVADAFDAALTAAGYDIDYYDLTLVPRDASYDERKAMMVEGVIQK